MPAAALAGASYQAEIQEAAARQGLAADPQWLRLGHYREQFFGGWESQADGASFFLSPEGKDDPAAELLATIAGLFAESAEASTFCRFPARVAWLNARLGLDLARLPVQACPRFQAFWTQLAAKSATMVFSSYYLNNPASTFGHTFLRLDQERGTELLDQGIDYSATVDTDNALVYGFKGLTGLFPGEFHRIPYFYKVREYNDYESRDLWEYQLALEPDELAMLVAHIWEVGQTWFDYWYLDENCSYHMLSLLEAAAPRLELLSHLGLPVLPTDTVRALYRNPGLVRSVRYRPSARTQLGERAALLTAEALDRAVALAEDPEAQASAGAEELDAALDLVDVRYARALVEETGGRPHQLKQRLLERRAELLVPSPELAIVPPFARQPHLGHASARAGLGGGWSRGAGPFAVLEARLSFHDLADAPAGHPELAEIEFLPVRLRFNLKDRSLWLEDASLVRVTSLTPLARFERRISWKLRVGATTVRDAGCAACLAGIFELGGGAAVAFFDQALALFATGDLEVLGAPGLAGMLGAPLRLGLGPAGGVRWRLHPRLVALATGSWKYLALARPRTTFALGLVARWQPVDSLALGVEVARRPREPLEGRVVALVYF